MAHSSWGSGWPNCQPSRINKSFYVDTALGRIRFPGGVREEICELVTRLVRETVNRGYVFGVPGDRSYGCWGYCCRCISGTSKPSNHSWGLALDINAPSNPYRAPLTTDMPSWMPDLWNAYGFRWGGDYTTAKKDAMHYEFMGSAADAKRYTEMARRYNLGEGLDNDKDKEEDMPPATAMAVIRDEIFIFARSADRHLWWSYTKDPINAYPEAGWVDLGGSLQSGPSAVAIPGYDQILVTAVGDDNKVWGIIRYPDGNFSGWFIYGGDVG